MAIYSVPSLVQAGAHPLQRPARPRAASSPAKAMRSPAAMPACRTSVWLKAKTGLLLKFGAGRQVDGRDATEMFAGLPDTAVRPLVDALIAQEAAAKIAAKDCGKIERLMDAVAPIDPK